MSVGIPIASVEELTGLDAGSDHLLVADASDSNELKKIKASNFYAGGAAEAVTVDTGDLAFTSEHPFVLIEVTGESGANDTVDTITGPGIIGQKIALKTTAGDVITLTGGTSAGNPKVAGASTAVVAATDGYAELVYNGTTWDVVVNVDNDNA